MRAGHFVRNIRENIKDANGYIKDHIFELRTKTSLILSLH